MLQADANEKDEEWFNDAEHNQCAFKQKIHNWMKDAEVERKGKQLSALDSQMCL